MPENRDRPQRRVVANIVLSLDGRTNGPSGEFDMSWIVPHAITNVARDHMVRLTTPATTALLGRKNYQGFASYWPGVAEDDRADPRDRAFSQWLNAVDKVVFSSTLDNAAWSNSRVVNARPADEVRRLRKDGNGEMIVLASASVIRDLLAADELDRLSIVLCPTVVGGGARLFESGLPGSSWTLVDTRTSESGALCVLYDRAR